MPSADVFPKLACHIISSCECWTEDREVTSWFKSRQLHQKGFQAVTDFLPKQRSVLFALCPCSMRSYRTPAPVKVNE